MSTKPIVNYIPVQAVTRMSLSVIAKTALPK